MGVAEDASLPDTWSTTENVAWAAEIPDRGWSSPIVVGDSIIVTSVISSEEEESPRGGLYFGGERPAPENPHRWAISSVDWDTGAIEWEREVSSRLPQSSRHLKTPSPPRRR